MELPEGAKRVYIIHDLKQPRSCSKSADGLYIRPRGAAPIALSINGIGVKAEWDPQAGKWKPPPHLKDTSSPESESEGSQCKKRKVVERLRRGLDVLQEVGISNDISHCPVCMDWFRDKIYQCDEGHLVCGACMNNEDWVKDCPQCKLPLQYKVKMARNRAVETLLDTIKMPCSFHDWDETSPAISGFVYNGYIKSKGCQFIGTKSELRQHEKDCIFYKYKSVKEELDDAEGGNGEAMYELGMWYKYGENGLAKDAAKAREWFERSAAARDPKGMAAFGECLLRPRYMSLNGLALVTVSQAAELGSDLAACLLGKGFKEGLWGLPMDHVRARFWIKKVVDGECKYIHDIELIDAAAMLRELDLLPAAERRPVDLHASTPPPLRLSPGLGDLEAAPPPFPRPGSLVATNYTAYPCQLPI